MDELMTDPTGEDDHDFRLRVDEVSAAISAQNKLGGTDQSELLITAANAAADAFTAAARGLLGTALAVKLEAKVERAGSEFVLTMRVKRR